MKKLILILIIAISLFAKGGWGEPVMVSAPETGVANQNCQIAVDHNGVLHVVWTELITLDYANLKYSQSTDGGKTWSPQINLTPDNTTERVGRDPRIVIDSENNVHIIFYYIDAVNPIYYLNNSSGSWSAPEYLGIGLTSVPLFEIDQDDRLYIAFFSGDPITGKSYYVYKDKTGNWTTPSSIPGINGDGRLLDLFAYNSDLYAVGSDYIATKSQTLARLYKYSKSTESWTDAVDISDGSSFLFGSSVYVTENDTVHVAIYDSDVYGGTSIYLKSGPDLNSWSKPDTATVNIYRDKQIFVDKDNNPHIFEHNNDFTNIVHTYKYFNTNWENEIIQFDSLSNFSDLHVAFNNSDQAYIIYESEKSIYFQTKVVTGIENSENSGVINDYNLRNYPNPFNPETSISFSLDKKADINLTIINEYGQLVNDIFNGILNKGIHKYNFNAMGLNSGVYFIYLEIDGKRTIKKSLLLK